MKALFISDLHLCDERPATVRAFVAFVRGPARGADALYILGDLFEYWAGDDDDTPLGRLVAAELDALSDAGTAVFFVAGNRDFLLAERFARAAGITLLPDPTVIDLDGRRLLLSHGDALCTDDVGYQRFRTQVRDPAWQRGFLEQPLAERKRFIEDVRRRSIAAKADKAVEIMDVNPAAVTALLRSHGLPTLIHGHTHRPARHEHVVDGRTCERWVLADWEDEARYLACDGGTLEARRHRAEQR